MALPTAITHVFYQTAVLKGKQTKVIHTNGLKQPASQKPHILSDGMGRQTTSPDHILGKKESC